MIQYLKDQYGNRPSSKFRQFTLKFNCGFIVNANERMELEFLRTEVAKLRENIGVRLAG